MVDKSDLIQQFSDEVLADNLTHASYLSASLAGMSLETSDELVGYIEYCLSRGLSLTYLAECYNTVTADTHYEQIHFRRHGKYRYRSFAEVAQHVYFDEDYMKKYMHGLALTAFLWPNHSQIREFFVNSFPKGLTGTYLEVGPGHGYYFRKAAQLGNFNKMIGIDISPASVEMSRDIMQYYQVASSAPVQIEEADFLNYDSQETSFSCIVMGEVLEHVEQPAKFLAKITNLSSPDTHIYITTCLNAPAVDHIFLFSSSEEVEVMARGCDLAVKESYCAPYAGKTLAECEAERLPVNVAYVLRKS